MKRILIIVTMALSALCHSQAQTEKASSFKAFNHMDLSLKVGTTGYGFDVSTNIGDFARLRSGFSYMPSIEVPMTFGIQVGNDPAKSQSKFEKMAGLLESFIGQKVDSEIDMIGRPKKFWNWDVMVDFLPLKNNKHWHVTAGFSLGPSHIAEAFNTTEDMPSLMAVNMYNRIYDKLINDKTTYDKAFLYEVSLFDFADVLGDKYKASSDPELLDVLYDRFEKNGRMGVHVGDYVEDILYQEDVYIEYTDYDDDDNPILVRELVHKKGDVLHHKGDPYMIEPDENGMVKANMSVNRFKPYLGIGYEGRLIKNDDRYKIGFDMGVWFWGGTPEVKTHEGVDLTRDVTNIKGKVGRYVDVIEKFKVYPVISLRLTRKLF